MSKPSTLPQPNINDVKPGGGSHKHPGNRYYSELISKKKVAFVMARDDHKKRDEIVLSIYDDMLRLSPPGRFLNKNSDGSYSVKSKKSALTKIKTALSENNSKIIEHLKIRGKWKTANGNSTPSKKPTITATQPTAEDWRRVSEMLK